MLSTNPYANPKTLPTSLITIRARMVIRDVGRVLGLAYGFVDSISKMIPFDPSRPQNLTQCIAGELPSNTLS